MSNGAIAGFLCSRCQTPEENAEAEINLATLEYDINPEGRATAQPKYEEGRSDDPEPQPEIHWISRNELLKAGYTVADLGPLAGCKKFAVMPLKPETESDETMLALGSARDVRAALQRIAKSDEPMDVMEFFPVVVPLREE